MNPSPQPQLRLDRKKSNDHIFQEWSMIEKGKETREIFTFERVD
jgi:hypothetical protein